jgi:hypothetical protein
MRVLRFALLGSVLALAFCSATVDASSDVNQGGSGSGGNSGNVIYAGVQYGKPPSGHTSADSTGCTWAPSMNMAVAKAVVHGITYRLFVKTCPSTTTIAWVPQIPHRSLATNAAAKVRELLDPPSINAAPPVDSGVVNVGTWLWTNPNEYKTHSITAWIATPGGISWTTTTAKPVRLVFNSGEPGATPMTCQGPGQAWNPTFGDDTESPCMYTYRHSSEIMPSGTFQGQLSIVWSISWSSNVGRGGKLPDFVTTTTHPITVREIQAVVNS